MEVLEVLVLLVPLFVIGIASVLFLRLGRTDSSPEGVENAVAQVRSLSPSYAQPEMAHFLTKSHDARRARRVQIRDGGRRRRKCGKQGASNENDAQLAKPRVNQIQPTMDTAKMLKATKRLKPRVQENPTTVGKRERKRQPDRRLSESSENFVIVRVDVVDLLYMLL